MEFKKTIINDIELKFRNSDENVLIPSKYEERDSYFRAVWVSSICRDFVPSPNKEEMQKNLLEVLDYVKKLNMNVVIFHIRNYNNAYYPTTKAPIDANYGTLESFKEWDYLTWFIEECHKNNIEFHAWLNPYRIRTDGYPEGTTPEDVAKAYVDYPENPAIDPSNILMTYAKGAILNPSHENVQKYIVDVCLEVMEKYDVDAIHFDDYFYAQMSEKVDILGEADDVDYFNFIKNNPNCNYKENSVADKQQWRRDNVDKFIYDLSVAIRKFNKENNRQVQLGISPTGIYKNGDGVVTYDENGTAITNGSNTIGQQHYGSFLFCDTKKWIDNEWIDYIIPQSYWGFTHPVAGFADVMTWWDKVVKNKKVNLYSGMGIYMAHSQTTYSWALNPYEASDQILYCMGLENVKGTCMFNFRTVRNYIDNEEAVPHKALQRLETEYWTKQIKTPKTMANE